MAEIKQDSIKGDYRLDSLSGFELESILPCTEPQLEILTACILGGDDANRSYNQSITLHFHGKLSQNALGNAINKLVIRHQSFRCLFDVSKRSFMIMRDIPVKLAVQAMSSGDQNNKALSELQHREAMHVFDLRKGPLFRATLLTDGDLRHYLLLNLHHVVCDGWSLALTINDLGKLYSAEVSGSQAELPESQLIQDYLDREAEFKQSSAYQNMLEFWTNQFTGYMPVPALPYDYPRTATNTFKSRYVSFPFKNETFKKIRATADNNGCSVMVTMASVFELLLFSHSGSHAFVLGIPAADQAVSGFGQLIGHFVHLLPVKTEINEHLSFNAYLSRRKTDYAQAFLNRRVTFGSLIKQLKTIRNPRQSPLVSATFNIDRPLTEGLEFAGLKTDLHINKREYSSFDLIMNLSRRNDELVVECAYNEQLFKPETIGNMVRAFEALSETFSDSPDQPVGSLLPVNPRLPKEKKSSAALLNAGFSADAAANNDVLEDFIPVHRLIENVVDRFEKKYAIIFRDLGVSYGELNRRANRLAHYLISKGIQKGDVVAIALDRSVEMIVSIFAVLKAGAAYLPIDVEYPRSRIAYMLDDSGCKIYICGKAADVQAEVHATPLVYDAFISVSNDFDDANPDVEVQPSDSAYIIYTSGSTGQPKGVILEHGNLFAFLKHVSRVPGLSDKDRLLAVTSISFDISILEVFLPYVHGATAFLLDRQQRKEPADILRYLELYDITVMFATPTHWKMLLKSGWSKKFGQLRVISGGEALKQETAQSMLPLCHSVWNIYGPTETTVFSTIKQITDPDEPVNIGKAVVGTNIYILDADLQPVPPGQEGEIVISGIGVGRGYINKPELSAEKFLRDPFSRDPNQRMYRSGDLGKQLENGDFQCVGRLDHQVKIRGFRIELGEIEYSISKIKGIKEVVVIARTYQGDDVRLKAYVILEEMLHKALEGDGNPEDPHFNALKDKQFREWRSILATELPEYMIPTHFIIMEKFPMNANGKIDRLALPSPRYRQVSEKVSETENMHHHEESMLQEIWRQALGLSDIGYRDNFFELGGHSLIAIGVMSDIEKHTGVKLPISSLFEYPTIEKMAELLRSPASKSKWKSLVPIKPNGNKRPIYIVHGAGLGVMNFNPFIPFLDNDQPVFGLQAHGINKDDVPLETIEEMASNYIEEIVNIDPEGPYLLSGYSAGCVIAFEMAKQLHASGKTVGLLALLDYSTESIPRNLNDLGRIRKKFKELLPRFLFSLRTLSRSPNKALKFQIYTMKLSINGILKRLGLEKPSEKDEDLLKTHILKAMDVFNDALMRYEMKPYDGVIDLFVSEDKLYFLRDRKYLGWKKFGLKGLKVHMVKGDHEGMFLPPHNVCFAKTLQAVIDQKILQHNTQNETDSRKHTHR